MKIDEILIKGWRSFNDEGANLSHLKKVNIIIGPNNSGKSNLGRLLRKLKEMMIDYIEDERRRYSNPSMRKIRPPTLWSDSFKDVDMWKWLPGSISIEVFPCQKELERGDNTFFLNQLSRREKLSIKIAINENRGGIEFLICENGRKIEFNFLEDDDAAFEIGVMPGKKGDEAKEFIFGFWIDLMDSLFFVDPIRHYSRPHSANEIGNIRDVPKFYFNGADFISGLIKLQKNDVKNWTRYKGQMVIWLKNIVDDSICDISLVEPDQYRLSFKVADDEITQNLDALGTGVGQVVMLLSFLYLNKEKKLNVFMDEPEANLHSSAIGKLVQVFASELPNHNFFLTTHSPALLDQVAENWSIYRTTNKPHGATKFLSCNSIIQHYKLLDDLGIRASQILQTNMVIWVEGPSDAIYLKKWISDFSDEKLINGLHYSFLFYGGANLSSHTLLDDANGKLIDMLATNRYAAIICDSDCKSKKEFDGNGFKERVKVLIERLEEIATAEDVEAGRAESKAGINEFVEIWVTAGREIENYVPEDIFKKILLEPPFRKEFVKDDDGSKCLLGVSYENIKFGQFDSFDGAFAAAYHENGKAINDKTRKKISGKYSQDKVDIARAVVNAWGPTHSGQFDLKERIESLVKLIKKANAMQV